MRQVAAELDVDHLLEGTVLRAGAEVRISAQLIEAVSDSHIWVESYRGSFADILELQERIARSIAAQVCGELAPGIVTKAVQEIDPEAREACMMGDHFLRKSQSEEEIEKAKNYYQEAIDRDPRYAEALAGLAFSYFTLGGYGRDFKPSQEVRDRVGMLIQQALDNDPENVRAHMVLGGYRLEWEWDWAGAEEEFQEVLRINPNHIETLNWYSELKLSFCEFDEQLKLVDKAYRLAPLDMVTLIHMYRYYRMTLQYRRSLVMLDRIDELYPGSGYTPFYRGWVYLLMGRYETAIKYEKQAMAIPTIAHFGLGQGFLAFAYGKSGQKEKAMQIIEKMIEDREKGIKACWIGLAYCGVGLNDEALRWLEEAHRDHDVYLTGVAGRPLWGELHWDPRYQKIVNQMKLPLQLEYIQKALDKISCGTLIRL